MGRMKVNVAGRPLTARERQVIELLLKGKMNADCAAELGVSGRTIEVHRMTAMRKLELTSSVQLGYVFGYADGQTKKAPATTSPHSLSAPPRRLRRLPDLDKTTG